MLVSRLSRLANARTPAIILNKLQIKRIRKCCKKVFKFRNSFVFAVVWLRHLSTLGAMQVKKNKLSLRKKTVYKTRAAGLEPAISGVTGQRDNQLRYARITLMGSERIELPTFWV